MNRSSSEWAFELFLQESVSADHTPTTLIPEVDNRDKSNDTSFPQNGAGAPPSNIPIDSKEYKAYLKRRLELACAAVALSRVSNRKDHDSVAAVPDNLSQVSDSLQQASGRSLLKLQDDVAEGETETTENMDPTYAKRVRRMLSNRESARRSRSRKQAHSTELNTQVSQLKSENSSLLKRFADISQYNEAAVDNSILKADVEIGENSRIEPFISNYS